MNTDLSSRQALVCGGSAGIGLACAIELAALGASVTLVARRAEALSQCARELPTPAGQRHDWLALDLSDPGSARAGVESRVRAGARYHILVNNTGGPPEGTALQNSAEEYAGAFRAHLLTPQALVHALVPGMREAGYGRIVNVLSTSVKAPIPTLAISNTIRAGVAAWAKSLSIELGPHQITVNNVLPGFTATDRLRDLQREWSMKQGITEEELRARHLATIPMRRFGEASEIGAAVAFLCTPAASYISGINLPVDGGRTPTL
ncbi:MAG TPA: short-chain dehydrogenase [Phycisphaerales bacterium]|nr:short-chain dehydrogenase [Phycisphaerales bacterium]